MEGEAVALAVLEAVVVAALRTGAAEVAVLVVVRAVDAVGEVTFLTGVVVLVVDRTDVVVGFRVIEGLAVVATDPAPDATEDRLVTLGVAVARVVVAVLAAVVGVLEALTEEVGFVVVERTEEAGLVTVVFVVGDLGVDGVVDETGFLLAPTRPAAANEDIRVLMLGVLSVISEKAFFF